MLRMVSYPHRPQSGHIICYLNRTYHLLSQPDISCATDSRLHGHCASAQDSTQCSTDMNKAVSIFAWVTVGLLGAAAVAVIALHRGEPINALWLVVAATCCYALGYRFYSKFIAAKILALDALRATPDRK